MPIDTTELRRIVGAMTPGEWFSQECWPGHWSLEVRGDKRVFDCNEFDRHGEAKRADAAGIAYLKNNALALADEIDRLRADLAAAITVRDEAISDAEAHWDNLVVARNDARQLAAALESADGAIQVALAALREATK